jgi:hypothetical protein
MLAAHGDHPDETNPSALEKGNSLIISEELEPRIAWVLIS